MSHPNCYLLSSHDDFSVVSMLPPDVAVITQLRDPVDRFLSAYEFAVEVASRALRRPKSYRKKVGRIATEDVWPWSYLVPFFAEDMKPKVAKAQAVQQPEAGWFAEMEKDGQRYFFNKLTNETKTELTEEERARSLPLLDPYDNNLVISLRDFANHPIASELLHNGATFQVLGITNYSHWGDAGGFRACLHRYDHLRGQLLEVAKARVKRFTHVGTTDRLYDSAASALVSMGLSVDSPAYGGGDEDVAGRGGTRRRDQDTNAQRGGGGGVNDGEVARLDLTETFGLNKGLGSRGVSSEAAAQLQLLAKLIREARRRLQVAQQELVQAQRANADSETVGLLQNKVDTARNELIEAQEKLAAVRESLPANLGGSGSSHDTEANVGHAARRRLLQDTATASESSREQQQAGEQQQQQQQQQSSETTEGLGELEVKAEQRRRLASKVTLPTVDAFGNPLDPDFKRIARSSAGHEFVRCASRAQERSSSRREQSLMSLATADGRHVSFSKAARKRIPQEVLDLIRSYNMMDTPLHQLGLQLLDSRIAEQKAAQLFRELPQDERAHRRQRAAAEAGAAEGAAKTDEL